VINKNILTLRPVICFNSCFKIILVLLKMRSNTSEISRGYYLNFISIILFNYTQNVTKVLKIIIQYYVQHYIKVQGLSVTQLFKIPIFFISKNSKHQKNCIYMKNTKCFFVICGRSH